MRQEALQSFDFLFEDSLRRWIEAKRGADDAVKWRIEQIVGLSKTKNRRKGTLEEV